jgi:kanamycin kinase
VVTIAGPPAAGTPVPRAITRLANGAEVELVWQNLLGGVTARVGETFIKWSPADAPNDFHAEAERLRWAGEFHPVPVVLSVDGDAEGAWLITGAIAGSSAVSERWKLDPGRAARAVGHGLRAMHENLPVATCPFPVPRWTEHSTSPTIPVDDLVVCQGDPCAPNTLIDDDGTWRAHVDLGTLGPADRWSDLAVASMSLGWNFGDDWEAEFFDAYGIERDEERIEYYRALWSLG